jgi:hypothetical protein
MVTVATIIGLFFAALFALSRLVRPMRERMPVLARQLLDLELTPVEEEFVKGALATAYSWRSAPMFALAYLEGLFQTRERLESDYRACEKEGFALFSTHEADEFVECYFWSAVATNPVVGVVALALRFLFILKARIILPKEEAREIQGFVGARVTI